MYSVKDGGRLENKQNPNLRPFNSESGRESQKRSVEARKRNKSIRECTIATLQMPVTDKKHLDVIAKAGLPVPKKPRWIDFLVASVILNSVKTGKMTDLETLMQIVGEDVTGNATTNEGIEALNDLTNAIKAANNADNRTVEEASTDI